ncbi:hypothetical protein CEXT_86291 [Caerostris extrusa]|uniref:Uncharacterized protein n=1 Tax=Caerostris extrusa TaxID=172846 RepID=A0AAV4T1J5_CAEEX|nr:hypothetical protein CEXT_86291 [Caerostris extrusa]
MDLPNLDNPLCFVWTNLAETLSIYSGCGSLADNMNLLATESYPLFILYNVCPERRSTVPSPDSPDKETEKTGSRIINNEENFGLCALELSRKKKKKNGVKGLRCASSSVPIFWIAKSFF